MADKQIKDLTQITVNATSASDVYMLQFYSADVGDYVTRKITAADLGACLVSQVGYTLVLQTTNKTVLGAINEVNSATVDNTDEIETLSLNLNWLTQAMRYRESETASLSGVVLPVYDDGDDYRFTIPLSKPVAAGLEGVITGNFTIPGVLNDGTLSSLGTVTVEISPIGLNVTIVPTTYTAITNPILIGESTALITFEEENS